jgi:glutamine cyclotransferase
MRIPALAVALTFAAATSVVAAQAVDTYKVIHTYPHDPNAFTQGLVYIDGYMYESDGLYGHSTVRMVDIQTGRTLQQAPVASEYFGEGLTNWGSKLIQLTWKAHKAFVYDRFSFRQVGTMKCPWEGWGLAQDGHSLILSDGSANLYFLDPDTMRERRSITVKDHGRPVTQLNELEWIKGEIWANIWHSDRIARISPATGQVLAWVDLSGLLPDDERSDPEAVLNGIAYDAKHDRLYVTGKLWPKLFEIKVVPQHAQARK